MQLPVEQILNGPGKFEMLEHAGRLRAIDADDHTGSRGVRANERTRRTGGAR